MTALALAFALLLFSGKAFSQIDADAGPATVAGQAAAPAAGPAWPKTDAEMPKTTMDMIYYDYGTACFGMDWRFLRAVAQIESGQDPFEHTGKYVGLFQLEPGTDKGDTCPMFIKPFSKILGCSDLEDAEANTAVAAHRFHRMFQGQWLTSAGAFAPGGVPGIVSTCPSASVADQAALAYLGHNAGPAVLKSVLRAAKKDPAICSDRDKVRQAVRRFYEDNPNSRDDGMFLSHGKLVDCKDKAALVGKKALRCVDGDYGVRKYDYGLKKADQLSAAGIASLYPPGALNLAECPPFDETGAKRLFACGKEHLTKAQLMTTGKVCPD